MMLNERNRGMVLSALALALLLPASARAVTNAGPGDAERAQQLRAQAESLFNQPKEWGRAAKLLEASASLRTAADADAYACLLTAGRIRAALKDHDAAARTLGRAGDQALARGAVLDAALAYVFAAHSAVAIGDVTRAQEFGDKARLLTSSPLLTEAQKADVLGRIS